MNDWNIQSRAHQCQICNKPFENKEVYHTVLLNEHRDYQRQDVCQYCYRDHFSLDATQRKGFISQWQGKYEAPPAAPPDPIRKETAETLLRKILELRDPKFGAAAFILAVMLERKRLLKVKDQFQSEGRRMFIYEQPRTGDVFTIADPQLQLNQLEQVQHDVADLLEHGLPDVAPPQPAESASIPPADPQPVEPAPAGDPPPPESVPPPQ